MKRFATKLTLFLLLGAIINVAVAWGFALVGPTIQGPGSSVLTAWQQWPFGVIGFPPLARKSDTAKSLGVQRDRFRAWTGNPAFILSDRAAQSVFADVQALDELNGAQIGPEGSFSIEVRSFGWPLVCVQGRSWEAQWMREGSMFGKAFAIELTSSGKADARYLPLRPIWPGFAINTIFYAVVLWLPFAAFGRIRRRRRVKRGLCVRCGYDLRGRGKSGGGTCPECGASASKRS